YQRHVEKHRKDHARELVEILSRVVERDRVEHILLAGDEVIFPLLEKELPKELAKKVIDKLHLEKHSSEAKILETTMAALQEHDAKNDAERARRLVEEYRAGGLAVVGTEATRAALQMGEVDELLLSSNLDRPATAKPASGTAQISEPIANELVALAHRTAAKV